MRLVHVYVDDEKETAVRRALDEKDVDYAVTAEGRAVDNRLLFEFPVPIGAVEEVLTSLREVGVDNDSYAVITSVEAALTPNADVLVDEYDEFRPLPAYELRGKARSLTHDTQSFVWLSFLSAVVAALGLLIDSPAIVVGSMVIAPIIGPMLSASVGAVTGDGAMLRSSLRQQAVGNAVSVVGAVVAAALVRWLGLVPPSLDPASLELITLRLAPTGVATLIGLAAGGAAAYGLLTEGPLSIIGVTIAAALVPAAGAAGIGVVWGDWRLALGATLLLLITVVAINAAAIVTLGVVGRRAEAASFGPKSAEFPAASRTGLRVAVAVLLLVAAVPAVATYQQATYEREVNQEVTGLIDNPAYSDLSVVAVRAEYRAPLLFGSPGTVTVTLSRTSDADHPALPERIHERIREATGLAPKVKVHYTDYDTASS